MSTLSATRPPAPSRPGKNQHRPRPATTRRRSRELWTILALVAVTGLVHGLNVAGWPAFFDDEGTYLSQAFATYNGDLAPYTYWYDHPPAGWLQLASLAWIPAHFVETQLVAGRIVMVLVAMVSAALVYILARRLELRRGFAVAATLLWALSPLTVLESRQVFLDALRGAVAPRGVRPGTRAAPRPGTRDRGRRDARHRVPDQGDDAGLRAGRRLGAVARLRPPHARASTWWASSSRSA